MTMKSARVRQQELQDKSVQFPQLQAATVLAQAGQLTFAPASVRSDTSRPVAVGPAGEQLHNRLQVSSKTSHTILGRVALILTAVVSNCELRQLLLHLQSRPQSASVHKRKGWHALKNGAPQQPSQTSRTGNSKSAVYVRPDRSVNANIPLGSSPSFPSLLMLSPATQQIQLSLSQHQTNKVHGHLQGQSTMTSKQAMLTLQLVGL